MKSILQLWQYIRPYRSRIGLNLLFNFLSAIFSIFSLLMLIPFLKLLFKKSEGVAALPAPIDWNNIESVKTYLEGWMNYQLARLIGENGELQALLAVCIIVVIVFFLKNLFRYLAIYVIAPIKKGVIRGLHADIYSKLLHFPMSWFDQRRKGDVVSRFTSDVQEVEYGIMFFLESFTKYPVTILLTLGTMFFLSAQLTLIVLLTLPIAAVVIGWVGKQLKHESGLVQEILGRLVGRVVETIGGMRVIKSFTAQSFLEERFEKDNEEHFTWSTRMLRKRDLSSPLAEFLGILVVVVILWLGGRMVFDGRIQPETFITFIAIFSQIISPSKAFANAYYYIQKGLASLERIEGIIKDAPATDAGEAAAGLPMTAFRESIAFQQVSFAYGETPVIKRVSFEILKGERIALTGPSGAGKSTLIDLLLGLYPLSRGEILIDGQPLGRIDTDSWRSLVALVPQETILFHDTLYNNILFGRPSASREEVLAAADAARVEAFAGELPDGYDTVLGDNGSLLSGGQRQRVAIARAFLKNAPVLILDEATSSLDAENENIISSTLQLLPPDATVIIIAHRSATIELCDKVIELQDGQMTTAGSATSFKHV